MITAIMVDGGFYRKRAIAKWGEKTPAERAKELHRYCCAHLNARNDHEKRTLYRIFYKESNDEFKMN